MTNLKECMYTHIPEIKPTKKLACFDLDWTLIFNQKKLFPSDPDDVAILPKRRSTLKKLVSEGYSIVIFTNQHASSKKEQDKKWSRVETAIEKLEVPCWVFMASGKEKDKNKFRKPNIGMWEHSRIFFNEIEEVFYCGDAAGRPQDFSDSDKKFAENAGIPFKTPEEVFSKTNAPKPRKGKEMVVFVGVPGCGKTTLYKTQYSSYEHINQDTLKTRPKVLAAIKKAVAQEKSMVIDSTNPSLEGRQEYYKLAPDYKITVIYFARDGRGWNELRKESGTRVPTMAYHMFHKKFVPPTKEEIPGKGIFKIMN